MGSSYLVEITFSFAKALTLYTNGQKRINSCLCGSQNLLSALTTLDKEYPGVKAALCDSQGSIIDSINVYVNGNNVRYMNGLNTPLKNGDVVNIIPAAAAG